MKLEIIDGVWTDVDNPLPRLDFDLEVVGEYVRMPGNYVRRSDGFLDAAPAGVDGDWTDADTNAKWGQEYVALRVPGYWTRIVYQSAHDPHVYYAPVGNGRIVKLRRNAPLSVR